MRRLQPTYVLFAFLGGLLSLDLVLPLFNLLWHADWPRWIAALKEPGAMEALRVSVESSAIAVVCMTVLGVPLGYLLARARVPGKRLWIALVFLPMVVPDLAGGVLLLQTFGPYGLIGKPLDSGAIALTNNLAGIVIAQLFVAAPFVIISSLASFAAVDLKLEMAAATLGDSRWHIFRRVSLPLAWPGIAAGITLAWIRALGEFGATLIVAYNPHTLPVYMWMQFEAEGLAGALPLALCLVFLAAAAVAISMLLNRLTGLSDAVAPAGEAAEG